MFALHAPSLDALSVLLSERDKHLGDALEECNRYIKEAASIMHRQFKDELSALESRFVSPDKQSADLSSGASFAAPTPFSPSDAVTLVGMQTDAMIGLSGIITKFDGNAARYGVRLFSTGASKSIKACNLQPSTSAEPTLSAPSSCQFAAGLPTDDKFMDPAA